MAGVVLSEFFRMNPKKKLAIRFLYRSALKMTKDFFSQLVNSAQIGTALLIIGVALWVMIFRNLTVKKA